MGLSNTNIPPSSFGSFEAAAGLRDWNRKNRSHHSSQEKPAPSVFILVAFLKAELLQDTWERGRRGGWGGGVCAANFKSPGTISPALSRPLSRMNSLSRSWDPAPSGSPRCPYEGRICSLSGLAHSFWQSSRFPWLALFIGPMITIFFFLLVTCFLSSLKEHLPEVSRMASNRRLLHPYLPLTVRPPTLQLTSQFPIPASSHARRK